MNKKRICFSAATIVIFFFLSNCANEKGIPDYNGFPDDVGKIIYTKCATAGCHNDKSKGAAGGLSMESWDKLFEGGSGSACIIPYRHDYSTLFSYINTYPDMGVTLSPTMPYGETKLTRDEVTLLKNWINAGAPTRDGFVKFSDNPDRKKFYVTNQGCDVVTVFDQETLLPMRYINVGGSASTESPHMVRVSPDKQYWYVISLGGRYLEKYRTSDDSFVGRADINTPPLIAGNWNTFTLSNDGQKAYCIDWNPTGDIAEVDLNTYTVTHHIGYNNPHGSSLNPAGDMLYVTQQNSSNKLYKIPANDLDSPTEIDLFTTPPPSFLNAHDIRFTPDGTKYFVTCQGTSEVRAMQTSNDSLLAIIPVGNMPSEISFSSSTPYLFVTCMEDINISEKRGAVAIINYNDYSVSHIYTGHQPHGIEVDDNKKLVYVINRNYSSDGPAPHHSSECGGRNGNVSFIDLVTRTMVSSPNGSIKRVEISVDPYSVSVR
jgi:DNA-binding beta-propeller fold protein YncE